MVLFALKTPRQPVRGRNTQEREPMRLRILAATALLACAVCDIHAAAAATLERIKASGVVRIGYRVDARPHSFLDASGWPAGYAIDVCNEVIADIGRALGVEKVRTEFVQVSGESRFTSVRDGSVDLVCEASSMTMTRRAMVDFSLPTFVDGAGVLSRGAVTIVTFADLENKRVGVLADTTTERTLRNAFKALGIAADIRIVDDHRRAAGMVASGALDAYVADRSILSMLAQQQEASGLKLSPRYFSYETYGLVLEKGDSAFRLLVDGTIARLARSGRLEKLLAKAFGAEPDDTLRVLIALDAVPD